MVDLSSSFSVNVSQRVFQSSVVQRVSEPQSYDVFSLAIFTSFVPKKQGPSLISVKQFQLQTRTGGIMETSRNI